MAINYVHITIMLFNILMFISTSQAQVIHIFEVGGTSSKEIKDDIEQALMVSTLPFIAQIPSNMLRTYSINGSEVSWNGIKNKVESVNYNVNDSIIFIYVGHGYYNLRYGSFITNNNTNTPIYFTHIINLIENTNVRFKLIINDSCNFVSNGGMFAPAPTDNTTYLSSQMKKLFFESKGTVYIASSVVNEYAVCGYPSNINGKYSKNAGTLFTNALSDALGQESVDSWEKMHYCISNKVSNDFKLFKNLGYAPDSVKNQHTQTVRTLINGKEILIK